MRTAATLLEALEEHLDAITTRDIDRFAATLAPHDVRFAGGDGRIVEGRENVIAAHREWFMDDRWRFDPEILWTREEAGAAWALTRVTYREAQSSKQFLLLFLFVQESGAWRLIYDQNTPIP
ncbi:MAG TPA: nuclear transport factor 2 family protein [Candidatus Baltobacteraceae bacterium]|nr:nuclear transport factor 2 family protein [Candidatus Baltobacteraceae bacterium]